MAFARTDDVKVALSLIDEAGLARARGHAVSDDPLQLLSSNFGTDLGQLDRPHRLSNAKLSALATRLIELGHVNDVLL